MAKKSKFLLYIIFGLFLLITLCLLIRFLRISTEGMNLCKIDNEEDFTLALTIKLTAKQENIVPFPLGSYTITTTSGDYSNFIDFSMNKPVKIISNYDVDASNNVKKRIITISTKNTGALPYCKSFPSVKCDPNVGDVIPNKFQLDISFNQIPYKLETVAELISKKLPSEFLNIIDSDHSLNISCIGAIYDTSKNNIGTVSNNFNDVENTKAYSITLKNPTNNFLNIQKIVITFIIPLPLSTLAPPAPKPIDPRIINSIPVPDPDIPYSEMKTIKL